MNDILTRINPDLRVWLALLGVVFIVAVWIYNRWQVQRAQRQFQPETPSSHAPVSPEKQEPAFRMQALKSAQASNPVPDTVAQMVEIDESIHALIILNAEQPFSGERILAQLQDIRRAGKQAIVQAAAPLETGEAINASWVAIQPGARYETIIVAIQLANRSGPLNEIEYSQCVTALQQAAEQIPASCDAPDMMETVARARELDACCAPLDAQIGINLVCTQGVWTGAQIDALARQLGLILRADGRYYALTDEGLSLFSLQNSDSNGVTGFRADNLATLTTARLTLLLDVPRAPRAAQPYARMKNVALALAESLQGVIVDDDLRSLTPATLDAIEREIEPVYVRLEAEAMPAGSARALALFG